MFLRLFHLSTLSLVHRRCPFLTSHPIRFWSTDFMCSWKIISSIFEGMPVYFWNLYCKISLSLTYPRFHNSWFERPFEFFPRILKNSVREILVSLEVRKNCPFNAAFLKASLIKGLILQCLLREKIGNASGRILNTAIHVKTLNYSNPSHNSTTWWNRLD